MRSRADTEPDPGLSEENTGVGLDIFAVFKGMVETGTVVHDRAENWA